LELTSNDSSVTISVSSVTSVSSHDLCNQTLKSFQAFDIFGEL